MPRSKRLNVPRHVPKHVGLHWVNRMQKHVRAQVVARHLAGLGQSACFCLSCGPAAQALRLVGLRVIEIGYGPKADAAPPMWLSFTKAAELYGPKLFDATSGHLPMPLMDEIAEGLNPDRRAAWRWDPRIPVGSGESFVTLALAYPRTRFIPYYDHSAGCADYRLAPLRPLVLRLAGL